MKVKVCGNTELQNVTALTGTGVDLLGFIVYDRSPRYMVDTLTPEDVKAIGKSIRTVGVFVNAPMVEVEDAIKTYGFHMVQFHGEEPPEYCYRLKAKNIKVIKALPIETSSDLDIVQDYLPFVDYLLFDTKTAARGGSGKKFNWKILRKYTGDVPFFLSGGLSPKDANTIRALDHPALYGVDINSRFETEPGVKQVEEIKAFIKELKHEVFS